MRRKLIAPAALAGVLLVASSAWAPPPAGGGGRPPVGGGGRPPVGGSGSRPPMGSGSAGARPPIGSPKPAFGKSFEAARTKSATEAAAMLRTEGAFLARPERAALLNAVAHQLLRQKQAASLADLRRVHADWHAVGPGAGLDPILAMELEAAESAAERLLLAEILQLIDNGPRNEAAAKIALLESPRYLPAVVVQALPELRDAVMWFDLCFRLGGHFVVDSRNPALHAEGVWEAVSKMPPDRRPPELARTAEVYRNLGRAYQLFLFIKPRTIEDIEGALKDVSDTVGPDLARKLRAEMAAHLILRDRPKDATRLLSGEVDPVHAAVVLNDLRAAVLEGGKGDKYVIKQVAFSVATLKRDTRPASAEAILPSDRFAQWKPSDGRVGVTTLGRAIDDVEGKLEAIVTTEHAATRARMKAAADRVRAALAAEAAPLVVFTAKVEAMRGKPLAPAERELAAVAGARGLTVAEAVGVLAADADRLVSVGRLLSSVPACPTASGLAVVVELSGRAPGAFANHPDAGFKLTAAPNRARLRDAVNAVLGSHTGKAASVPLTRVELEGQVKKRLNTTDALPPMDVVQSLLDVCRDGADDHARLTTTARALDAAIAEIEEEQLGGDNRALRDEFSIAKVRRVGVQLDRQKAEAVVTTGCQLLGTYGRDAQPAAAWLSEQGEGKLWRAAAFRAAAQIAQW